MLVQGAKAQDIVLRDLLGDKQIFAFTPLADAAKVDLWSVPLTSTAKRVALVSMTRLLKLTASEYDAVRECLASTSSLGDLLDKLREVVYDNVYVKLMCDLLLSGEENLEDLACRGRALIKVPVEEPYRTLLTLIMVYSLAEKYTENLHSVTLLLTIDQVDEIYDLLIPLRRFRTYIVSYVQVRRLEVFDEVYMQSLSSKGLQILKIVPERALQLKAEPEFLSPYIDPISIKVDKADLVQNEILTLLRELGFMNLQSLRDSVSQNLGISKSTVDIALAKLRSLGLIEVRVLPDGRVLVYPTLLGLVKAAATGSESKSSSRRGT